MSSDQEQRGHFTESGTTRSWVTTNLNTDGKNIKREVHFQWKREALRIIFGPESQKQITFPLLALPSHLPAELRQLHGWPAQAKLQMDQPEPSEQPAEFPLSPHPSQISHTLRCTCAYTHTQTKKIKVHQHNNRICRCTMHLWLSSQTEREGGHQTEISHTAERVVVCVVGDKWGNGEAERLGT